MTRTMENVEGMARHRNVVAFIEPTVRFDIAHARNAVRLALLLQIVEQDRVVSVRAFDLDAKLLA